MCAKFNQLLNIKLKKKKTLTNYCIILLTL